MRLAGVFALPRRDRPPGDGAPSASPLAKRWSSFSGIAATLIVVMAGADEFDPYKD